MNILKKNVGEAPVFQEIKNGLDEFQEVVEGYIETVDMPIRNGEMKVVLVCNEEGLIRKLPYNFTLFGHKFYGNVFFCGAVEEEFCSYPYDLDLTKVIFRELWEGNNETH